MYSYFSNGSWSEPLAVEDDGTLDYKAKLEVLDGEAWLVWIDANRKLTSADTLDTAAGVLDISAARFDTTTASFTDILSVSSDEAMDALPEIASNGNGTITAIWARSDSEGFFAKAGQSSIVLANFDGQSWSEPTELYGNLNQLDKLALSYKDGTPLVAWTVDIDGDLTTTEDMELYLNGTRVTTNEVIDSKPQFAQDTLYWYSGAKIATIHNFSSQDISYPLFEDTNIPTDRFEVFENASGGAAIVFAQPDGLRSELYSYNYDSTTGQWGGASAVSEEGKAIGSFSGYLSASGAIVCATNVRSVDDTALASGNDPYGQADLNIVERIPGADIGIDMLYYDPDNLYAGNNLSLLFDVTNKGNLAVHGLSVEVLDAQGGLISSETLSDVVQPGAALELKTSYQVPEDFSARSIQVRIQPLGVSDADIADNTQSVELDRIDASLEAVEYGFTPDDKLMVYAGIVNRGLSTLNNVTVNLTDDSDERIVLATQTIESLEPYNVALLRFDPILSSSGGYCVEVIGPENETMVGNNDMYLLVTQPGEPGVTVGNPGSGDFNGDGHVAASEALLTARAVVLGTNTFTAEQIDAMDMDRDGRLTMADAVLILRKAAGL
jgi:hypothetical protein